MDRKADNDIELWYGTVAATSIRGLIHAASRAGFRSVAVHPGMHRRALVEPNGLSEVRGLMEETGVVVSTIDPLTASLPGVPSPQDVPERFREFLSFAADECIEAAHALGARTVCIAPFLGGPAPYDEALDAVSRLSERIGAAGLRAAVEFMPGTLFPDLPTALRIWQEVDAPHLGIVFDTWHFVRTGGTTELLRTVPSSAVAVLQVSDRREPTKDTPYVPMSGRLLPGDGELPLADWVGHLVAERSDLSVGAEIFSDELRALPVDVAAAQSAAALRKLLASL
ncbi:sugar phosphate isomerase/epimerase family protein [Parafrankia sp. FMc2]|uniref:sugar phosphate isomerase/epimerase family protein n=1 Tax=Parafrankia sp. FMc2 TaxID=3233196 RepID=UPI0034D62481